MNLLCNSVFHKPRSERNRQVLVWPWTICYFGFFLSKPELPVRNAFYYSYFQELVDVEHIGVGLSRIIWDRRTEYPDVLNAIRRFNIYQDCYHRCLFHSPVDLLWGQIRITSSVRLDWTRWPDSTDSTLFATALAFAGDFGGLGISDAAKFGLCIASSVSLLQMAHCSAERPGSGTKSGDGSAWSRSNLLHLVTGRPVCEHFGLNSLGPARHFSVSWQIKFRAIP